MNTKNLNFVVLFVFFTFLLSCSKNEIDNAPEIHDYRVQDILYPKNSKLKRVYQVFGDNKNLSAEYQYDDLGRIIRVDFGDSAYDLYLYNAKGQLETINKHISTIIQTITYSYDAEGNKVKELYEWKDLNSEMRERYFLYQYSGKKLIKQEQYWEDQHKLHIVYEYKDDILVKEKSFVPGSKDYLTTDHFYEQNLLVYSMTYGGNSKSDFASDVKRYYDHNDNLIRTVSNIPGLSSMAGATVFLVTREYEYE